LTSFCIPLWTPKAEKIRRQISKGLPASPGAAVGQVVFSAAEAEAVGRRGQEQVILVRIETSPDDIRGMNAAEGILTSRGGMTSHAAVVARGMGKSCVAGAGDINRELRQGPVQPAATSPSKRATGSPWTARPPAGHYQGQVPTVQPELTGDFGDFMGWVDEFRTLGVRTNADTPHDSQVARRFGAEGIGLTRTEHMFFEGDRIAAVREMILPRPWKAAKRPWTRSCPCSARTLWASSRPWTGCR
jgi:pyruvate,orthophosphate dikinase